MHIYILLHYLLFFFKKKSRNLPHLLIMKGLREYQEALKKIKLFLKKNENTKKLLGQ